MSLFDAIKTINEIRGITDDTLLTSRINTLNSFVDKELTSASLSDKNNKSTDTIQSNLKRPPINRQTTPKLYNTISRPPINRQTTPKLYSEYDEYIVTASSLNVRSGPGTLYDRIGLLRRGEKVLVKRFVTGSKNKTTGGFYRWAIIDYEGGNGYISSNYIAEDLEEPVTTASTTSTTTAPSTQSSTQQTQTSSSTKPPSSLEPPITEWSSSDGIELVNYNLPPQEDKYVSSPEQYEEYPYYNFDIPGYSRAKMSVTTNKNGRPSVYHFEFLIGPNTMTEDISNIVNPVKTGGGYFIMRNGPALSRLTLSGYFFDSHQADERRTFLQSYYNEYLVDKINAFHEYFNESKLVIEVNGFKYHGIITDLQLSQTSTMMFIFRYNMSLLVTSQEHLTIPNKPQERTNSIYVPREIEDSINLSLNTKNILNI